jgi:uncharacterized protein involved in oxidation of intracellular sulfur
MKSFLFVLNGAPYGSENTYNGLRLAGNLVRQDECEVRIFLMGDAAASAKSGQKVPQGYYNVESMMNRVLKHNGVVGVCGTCMDARGITNDELAEGCARSTLDQLTKWTMEADKILVF